MGWVSSALPQPLQIHRQTCPYIDMNASQRYNAALLIELRGWMIAVNYIRSCLGCGLDAAIAHADEIAAGVRKEKHRAGEWRYIMDYKTLNALPPETFLDPMKFATDYDTAEGSAANYAKGVDLGQKATTIHIESTGVWSASMMDRSSIQSYEGIGYHANTAALLKGFLDSGAKIVVSRWDGSGKVIKEGKPQTETAG